MAATAEARLIVRYFGRFAPRVGEVMKSTSAHSMTPTHIIATSAESTPSAARRAALAQRSNSAVDRSGPRSIAGEKLSPYDLQCFGRPSMH